MRNNLYLILILTAGFTGGLKAQTITGSISNSTEPLSGANVKIEGKKLETSSDKNGHYELKLEAGTYNVVTSYIGYKPVSRKINIAKDQTLNLDVLLTAINDMDEVVVVSSRKPSKISEIPGTVWVVDNARLQEQIKGGVSFKEALAQLIPGLDVGGEGRSSFGQNLRGRNVLIMIDGVSLNSTRNASRQLDAIDPFNIERIEVLSGASAIYGGGATGGIVNIISKKGQNSAPSFTTEAGARSGLRNKSDHDVRVAQSISGGSENFKGRIGIAYQKNNAAFGADNKQIFTDITQTDLQYNQSFDIFANTEFKLTPKQTLKVNAQYYNSGYVGTKDLYLGANFAGLLGNTSLLELRDGFSSSVTPRTARASISADYHAADVLGGQDLYIQALSRNEKLSFHPFPGALGSSFYSSASVQATTYNALKLVLSKKWSAFSINYGIDADNESYDAKQMLMDRVAAVSSGGFINRTVATNPFYPGFTVNGLSGFMQAQWNITTDLSLSGGVRQQRMYVKVNDFISSTTNAAITYGIGKTADVIAGGKNHYDVNLLNGGLIYKISVPEQIWVNYAQGFSLADPSKYYGQGQYLLNGTNWDLVKATSVANSPLTGIKTQQFEAGWRHRSKVFNAQIAGFYSWSDKNIQTDTKNFSIIVLDQKRRDYGVEGSLSANLNNGFEIGGNGLYIKSKKKVADLWQLQKVDDASPSKATAYIGWRNKAVGFKIQGLHSFDLKDDEKNKDGSHNRIKGFTTIGLLGNVNLPLGSLSFGVQNLLNKEYDTIWSQRAKVSYAGLGVNPHIFDYQGRGRTYNLTYTVNY